jgi:hypothetical protein
MSTFIPIFAIIFRFQQFTSCSRFLLFLPLLADSIKVNGPFSITIFLHYAQLQRSQRKKKKINFLKSRLGPIRLSSIKLEQQRE